MATKSSPIIYNLMPREYPTIYQWDQAIKHAADMHFTHIFLNPVHETGYSGSLYAIKNFYRLNPLFLRKGEDPADWKPFRDFVSACKKAGLQVIVDLVINHTAEDADLVQEHPSWYVKEENGAIAHPYCVDVNNGHKVVWGDLSEINNENSPDRENLWKYWDGVIAFFQKMGVKGFRCDAAYKVSAALWRYLINAGHKRDKETIFLAETLGCTIDQTMALKDTGFDFLFNSSKYWNFDSSWCLDQHEQFAQVAPSISFPESHDTQRLAAEHPGSIDFVKSRYLFATLFSQGVMIPVGFEYGARRKLDVVRGTPSDGSDRQWDLCSWIASVNEFKACSTILREEGHWSALRAYHEPVMALRRYSNKRGTSIGVVVNKEDCRRSIALNDLPGELREFDRYCLPCSRSTQTEPLGERIELGPWELAVLL